MMQSKITFDKSICHRDEILIRTDVRTKFFRIAQIINVSLILTEGSTFS